MKQLPLFTRATPVETIDVEKRTAELVFTTGAAVRRLSWDGPFDEVLLVTPAAVNLDRLRAGAPLLDSHFRYSLDAQLGVVEEARVADGKGYAVVRFPAAGISEQTDRMFGMVRDKIVRNVSVGYSIDRVRVEKATAKAGVDQWIVERWTPSEISLVTIPADAGAQVRADAGARSYPIEFAAAPLAETTLARMRMRQALAGI